jgi:broad specificity phosphatase PhoE
MGWATYKADLRAAGAMDIQRPIRIKAEKVKESNSLSEEDSQTLITTKIVHFQRHGQGYHNLLGDITREFGKEIKIDNPDPKENPFVRPEIQDSPLTHFGRSEAMTRQSEVKSLKLAPEVVIVSPLHRAIQTALITFESCHKDGIPFVAHEGCREQLGLLTCNKALPLSQTKVDFPTVDFDMISHGEEDSLWSPKERERPVPEANRVYNFLTDFLMHRTEEEIAVVCHSAWLFSMCNAVVDCGGDEGLESWFGTSEIRSLKISFHKDS